MELNLSGTPAPYFTSSVVIVTDSTGAESVGEVPGGGKIIRAREDTKHLVLGTRLVDYKATLFKAASGWTPTSRTTCAACRPAICVPACMRRLRLKRR